MKPKTRFLKMYYKLPSKARFALVYNFPIKPMNLNVCKEEIVNNTKLGEKILFDLGYEMDD